MNRPSPSTVTDEGLVARLQKREHYFRNAVEGEYDANLLMHARFHIDELASGHTALLRDNERLRDQMAEIAMNGTKWMQAHDKLKAGKPYDLPKPADLPERVAALLREIEPSVEKLKALRVMCDSCSQPLYVQVLDEVIAALSRPLAERE